MTEDELDFLPPMNVHADRMSLTFRTIGPNITGSCNRPRIRLLWNDLNNRDCRHVLRIESGSQDDYVELEMTRGQVRILIRMLQDHLDQESKAYPHGR